MRKREGGTDEKRAEHDRGNVELKGSDGDERSVCDQRGHIIMIRISHLYGVQVTEVSVVHSFIIENTLTRRFHMG